MLLDSGLEKKKKVSFSCYAFNKESDCSFKTLQWRALWSNLRSKCGKGFVQIISLRCPYLLELASDQGQKPESPVLGTEQRKSPAPRGAGWAEAPAGPGGPVSPCWPHPLTQPAPDGHPKAPGSSQEHCCPCS